MLSSRNSCVTPMILLGLLGSPITVASSMDQSALTESESHGHSQSVSTHDASSTHNAAKHTPTRSTAKKKKPSPSTSQTQRQLMICNTELHNLKTRIENLEAHQACATPVKSHTLSSERSVAPISYP